MGKRVSGLGLCCALWLAACGSDDPAAGAGGSSGGQGGSAGTGGSAGDAGAGGSAGEAGAGGSAGEAGAGAIGGSGGTSGSGGNAGSGGASGSGGSAGSGGASGSGGNAGSGGAGGSSGEGGSAGTGGGEPSSMDACTVSPWDAGDFANVLDVGPGQPLATPSDVPWETIGAGTLVRIHARSTPYLDKWVLNVAGTENAPVVVRGVPDTSGALPQIRGDGAITRAQLNFWGEERSIIKIGGSNTPDNDEPSWIYVECLDIAGARAGNSYTGDDDAEHTYLDNAAPITIETGDHIVLRNNVFSDSGNGLFAASESSDVRVIGNHIFGNGNVGSIYEHNSYTESLGILFEGNHYGPLCDGCLGNNLKDRSAGTVIRYNWIESGNRQLDLVDSDHDTLLDDPRYGTTFVYGNVLIEPDGAGNSQIVHYGGDSGAEDNYRKGTLHFFHNTVVSTRGGNTTLVRLSSAGESIDARNNIVNVSAAGTTLAITDGNGAAELRHNWLPTGWRSSHSALNGTVMDVMGNVTGGSPGFADAAMQDFALAEGSACIDAAGPLSSAAAQHSVSLQIASPTVLVSRPVGQIDDIGAIER